MSELSDIADGTERGSTFPRAVVHKRILSVAESRPDASMAAIAEEVSGATTSMVEQVLDEYGDPGRSTEDDAPSTVHGEHEASGENRGGTADGAVDSSADDSAVRNRDESPTDRPFDPDDITEKQLETLREIRRRPDATQATLAERLGVSSATINQRVNGIDGFDWSDRRAFVERLFERDGFTLEGDRSDSDETVGNETDGGDGSGSGTGVGDADDTVGDGTETALGDGGGNTHGSRGTELEGSTDRESVASDRLGDRVAELAARVETLERQRADTATALADPELAHKIVHACFSSEHISDDEELRILRGLLETGD